MPPDDFDWHQQAREIRSARIWFGCVCAAAIVVVGVAIWGVWP